MTSRDVAALSRSQGNVEDRARFERNRASCNDPRVALCVHCVGLGDG